MKRKMSAVYCLRIPLTLKKEVRGLTPIQRNDLNHRIRIEIARAVHSAKFDPGVYLEENHKC